MKKTIALLLAILMLITMLTACASKEEAPAVDAPADAPAADAPAADEGDGEADAEGKTKLTIWVNGGEDAYIPTQVSYFNEVYPDIELDLLYVPQNDVLQKITTTISSGGELPDVVDINYDDLGQLMALDCWEDFTAAPYNLDTSLVAPIVLDAMKNDKGEMVAMINEIPVCGVAYDRNLAKQYLGTDDPDELRAMLQTNEDYIKVAQTVTEASGGEVYAFSCVTEAYQMIYSQIKDPFVVDGKLVVDDTIGEAFQFVEQLRDLNAIDLYEQWSNEWVANISDSYSLFYFCPAWFTDWGIVVNDMTGGGRWGIITPPSPSTQGGEVYMIPKDNDPAKKQAAYTFISWLTTTDEGAQAFWDSNKGISSWSGNLEGAERFNIEREEYGGQRIYDLFIDIANMEGGKMRTSTKYDSGVFDVSNSLLIEIMNGMSADEALVALKEGVQSRYPDLVVE